RRLGGLAVYDETRRSATGARRGLLEIPLDAILGTTEPNRAAQFDHEFRPAALTRCRWQSVWLAFHRGATLPPISVIQVGDDYAIRDGPPPGVGRQGARRADHPRGRRLDGYVPRAWPARRTVNCGWVRRLESRPRGEFGVLSCLVVV
ncbi:MAG: hypothetical protein ACRDPC_24940, partial [Solirubrobacteraceae bacterium]